MKIYLTKSDVVEIVARQLGLETINTTPVDKGKELSFLYDEVYWESNESEKTA